MICTDEQFSLRSLVMSLFSNTVAIEHALSQTCRKCTAKYSLSDLPYKYLSISYRNRYAGTIHSTCGVNDYKILVTDD